MPAASGVRVTVHDVAGRRVRVLHDGFLPGGAHAMSWDGKDGAGRAVASGAYFIEIRGGSAGTVERVVRVK